MTRSKALPWNALPSRLCRMHPPLQPKQADVAELADALDSGSSGGNPVEVQVLSSALN